MSKIFWGDVFTQSLKRGDLRKSIRFMAIQHYDRGLKSLASGLRKNCTKSEAVLWTQLKGRKVMGYKFIRQRLVSSYIIDFYCKELRLGIELDEISHSFEDVIVNDEIREQNLAKLGIKLIRFNDEEVLTDLRNVVRMIEMSVSERKV